MSPFEHEWDPHTSVLIGVSHWPSLDKLGSHQKRQHLVRRNAAVNSDQASARDAVLLLARPKVRSDPTPEAVDQTPRVEDKHIECDDNQTHQGHVASINSNEIR